MRAFELYHAAALDLAVTADRSAIIEQAGLAISMSILNYFKKASSPRIDPKDKGDSDTEVPALTTSGIAQCLVH